jgi:tetratricopeptide (TPR) repeat protein
MNDLINKANAEFKQSRYQQALNIYTKAVETEPDNYESCIGVARCLVHLKQFDRAIQTSHRALELKSDAVEPHTVIARVYLLTKR